MVLSYQWPLVAFSTFIAIFASYSTLRLAGRLIWAERAGRLWWIAGGATVIGVGIWAMHFIGLLAVRLPVPLAFDPLLTALSILPAILAALVACFVLSRRGDSGRTRLLAALFIGAGIVTMHFSGMEAMRVQPPIAYDPLLLALYLLIAGVASWGALLLMFRERASAGRIGGSWEQLLSALVMGLAVSGMHHTGVAAARFEPDAVSLVSEAGLGGSTLGLFIGLGAVLILLVSVAATFYDEVAGENSFYRALLAAQSDAGEGVLLIDAGRIVYANAAMGRISGYTETELQALSIWTDLFEGDAPILPEPRVGRERGVAPSAGRVERVLRTRSGQPRACEIVLGGFLHADTTRHLLVCFDISERMAAEEQVRDLALVAARTDNAVIITDAQGRVLWVNEGFEKISGYTLAEVAGRKPGSLLQGPQTDAQARDLLRAHLQRGEDVATEIVNYHKSGRMYWIAIDIKPVHDASGVLVKFIAVERDITERKLAEEALRRSEAQAQELAMVASGTDNAVLILDARARITWANAGFSRMSGYSLDEVLGRRPGELLNGAATDPAVLDFIQGKLARGERFETEIVHYRKSGQPYWAVIDVQAVQDGTGRIAKYISIERDITKHKEAEAALRESESRLKEAQGIARIGSWELDLLANRYWLSEEALLIHELVAPDGWITREAVAATHDPEDVERLRELRKQAMDVMGNYSFTGRLHFADGRTKHVQVRGAVHADDGIHPNRVVGTVQDITEQKLAEMALLQSEARLKEAQRLAHIGNWEYELATDDYLMSEEALRIHELTAPSGRVSRDRVVAIMHPEDRALLHQHRTVIVSNGGSYSLTLRLVFSGGRTKHVEIRGAAHANAQGETERVAGTIQDITEQKLVEQALQQREAQASELALVAARTDNAVIISDAKGGITWVNEGFTRLYGYLLPEVQGRRAADVLRGPGTDLQIQNSIRQRLRGGENVEEEILHYAKGGRGIWIDIDVQVIRDDGGRAVKYISIARDVSSRKQAEMDLLTLNETLEQRVEDRTRELDQQRIFTETILETAEDLIFVVDNHGRFIRFNRACERLTGYSFEEVRGRPLWEFVITPERRNEVRRKLEDVRSIENLQQHLEVEWFTKDGQRRLLSWSNAFITDEQGWLEYMIGTGIDITERKRAEQALVVANENLSRSLATLKDTQSQLVQAEKMASLGGLVAGISHEINTPLGIGVTSATSLQEELRLLKQTFEAGTMKRSALERFLGHAEEGASILVRNLLRAAELIRSFKQVAVDQSSDEPRKLDLSQYIDEVILSLQPRFKGSRVRVVNESERGLELVTQPGAIYQILSNLLINSLIHAYAAGQPGTIRVRAWCEGGDVRLDCSDDGKGVPADIQDRIFDPFFTTRRGSGGSGLGLHIVFNLVVSTLNGRIELVKNMVQGTTFRIRFPMIEEQ